MQPTAIDILILNENWADLSEALDNIDRENMIAHSFYANSILIAYGKGTENNLPKAILELKKALNLDHNNSLYKTILSTMLLQSNEVEEAQRYALEACKTSPKDPTTYMALARSFLAQKQNDKAYNIFKRALSYTPKSHQSLRSDIQTNLLKLPALWNTPLIGKRLTLTRVSDDHFDYLLKIRNNDVFRNKYNMFHKTSVAAVNESIAFSQKSPLETNKIEWIIEQDAQPVGLASLVDINFLNSRAELLIGFPDKGNGWQSLEATLLVLEFAFKQAELFKVYSYVYSDNMSSQNNTLHLGFTQEGTLRSHVKRPGTDEWLDLIVNGCLAHEFYNNIKLIKLFKRVLGRELLENALP